MTISFDSKFLPYGGQDPQLAVVLLNARNVDDPVMRELAGRWRPHLTTTLFAMPRFSISPPETPEVDGLSVAADLDQPATGLAQAAAELSSYIDDIRLDYGLANSQIALVGFAEGMTLSLYYGLRQTEALCAIIGFSGTIEGFSDLHTEIKSQPPVLLVHGEKDDVVSPTEFLANLQGLQRAGVPAAACFRPNVGHSIDPTGADSAMFFLSGAHAARGHKPAENKKRDKSDLAKSIKLVIWDLDETLWRGTLDDADTIVPFASRLDAIRRLNRSGIVSAICSKNDFETARKTLESLELWDEFVFPRIAFVPKGAAIQSLIADMQLKPRNCLFIDDNDLNLAEAKSMLPDLHVLDAKSDECDAFLLTLVEHHANVDKSRVEEYRALQNRVNESQAFDGSRESFLQGCDIHVSIAGSSDLIHFAPRIEELINRTNQLNYLKTRVQPGSMVDFVSEAALREGFALFAWDKFGYHGLVGFIAVENGTYALLHMAFSCRIMHMGIENVLLASAVRHFNELQIPSHIPIKPEIPAWITVDRFDNPAVRDRIFAEEKGLETGGKNAMIRIMANCHSGAFSHFSGLQDIAEVDSHPRVFIMSQVLNKTYLQQNFPPAVVHFVGTDCYDIFWPAEVQAGLNDGLYEQCVLEFCAFLRDRGSRILLINTPLQVEPGEPLIIRGVTRERLEAFSNVWRRLAQDSDDIDFLDVDEFLEPEQIIDNTHLRVDASRKVAQRIGDWYNALSSDLPEQGFAEAV